MAKKSQKLVKVVVDDVTLGVPPEFLPKEVAPNEAILPLSVDYTNEGLNNMAKKINEIIEHLNGL